MKGAQTLEILRAAFAQRHVLAHDADDIGLLLDEIRKIPGIGHDVLVCRKRPSPRQAKSPDRCGNVVRKGNRLLNPVENAGISEKLP